MVRVSQLHDVIPLCINVRKNVVLEGPPGIGKTAFVHDFVEELSRREKLQVIEATEIRDLRWFRERCKGGECIVYIYLNVNTALPVDIAGIPERIQVDGETYATFVPLAWWLACREARYCIVFLDEYNTTDNPDMVAAVMRLLGECRAGHVDLGCRSKPRGFTVVVAAGNPSDSNAVAQEPPAPLLGGKVCYFRVEPPTIAEWIRYMHSKHGKRWRTEVAGFLAENPGLFARLPEGPRATRPYPTPRGWEAVALLPELKREAVEALVGPEAAAALETWMKTTPPSLEDIISSPREVAAVKAIGYAARGLLCRDLASSERLQLVKRLVEMLDEDALTAVTLLTSVHCPERMGTLWSLVPAEKKRGALRGREELAELLESGDIREAVEKLL